VPDPLLLLIVFLVLPVVLIFATAGCTGEDPYFTGKKEGAAEAKKEIEEESHYDLSIGKEPNLASYWRLNESEGAQVAVAVGPAKKDGEYLHTAGITLQHTGALALFEDKQDKAAFFKGTEGYIKVEYHGPLNPAELSVELWLQPAGVEAGPQMVLGSYEVDLSSNVMKQGYRLEVFRKTPPGGGSPQVWIRASVGNGFGPGGEIEADLGPGTQRQGWRHVVMTYKIYPASLKLYVDAATGDPAAEKDDIGYQALPPNYPSPLLMGGDPSLRNFYHGALDEVAIYYGVLSNDAIKKHYQISF
jgi:hypothetical protein